MPLRPAAVVSTGITDPTDIANCVIWLDFSDAANLYTDDMVTNVASDADLIYAAGDKSGSGNHFKQSDSGKRHTYKINIQNSLSASYVYEDNLRCINSHTFNDHTVFFAGNFTRDGNARYICGVSKEQSVYCGGAGALDAGDNDDWNPLLSIAYTSLSDAIGCVVFADSGYFQLNAVSTSGDCLQSKAADGRVDLGMYNNAYNPQIGYYYEYIVYNAVLSAANIAAVMDYLSVKWNIAVT